MLTLVDTRKVPHKNAKLLKVNESFWIHNGQLTRDHLMHLHDCTNKCTIRYVWTHRTNWNNPEGHTTPQEEDMRQEWTWSTQCVRHHQELCATLHYRSCSISRTLRQVTPRQKELILFMSLSYVLPYSFSSVAQQGPKAPHFDVSKSHTDTHTHPVEVPWTNDQPVAEASTW